MNRDDLHSLSSKRIHEATTLFENQCYDGAYYLAGYAVECALKACIAKKVSQHDFPSKELAIKAYSHNLGELVKVAELEGERREKGQASREFEINWNIVVKWSEVARYTTKTKTEAEELLSSIKSPEGVLEWIRIHW